MTTGEGEQLQKYVPKYVSARVRPVDSGERAIPA
jgi:hypothetical protein